MRIYKNCLEMVKEVERDLHEMGVIVHPETMQDKAVGDDKGYETKELVGYSYLITSPQTRNEMESLEDVVDYLKLNYEYIWAEFSDRISTEITNPGKSYLTRENVWKEFLHDGKFAYTYSERIGKRLQEVISQLQVYPNTRQGIVTVFNSALDYPNMNGKARIPCSMHYQFLIRQHKLDVIYVMRSCDFYTHFGYDVLITIMIRNWVAQRIGVQPGNFIHQIGSLHFYKKDKEGVF